MSPFIHQHELRPARLGFNLDLADPRQEDLDRQKVWLGKRHLRRFRGRVQWSGTEGVQVLVGEIPSGRVLTALLPDTWFDQVPPNPGQPFLLATWEGGQQVWDESLKES